MGTQENRGTVSKTEWDLKERVYMARFDNLIRDPLGGISTAPKDKKYDQGKALVSLMKRDFAKALQAVAEVTTYGVKKYNQPGSWRFVENALERYEDALGRHDLKMLEGEDYDEESHLLHAAHRAWNALATLELMLTDKEVKKP